MADKKICFIIMPYNKKKDSNGEEIDFDHIYYEVIQEPVERAGLKCIRCDELEEAGSIHEDMFTHIATSEVAIVDITTLNANVFYELGARHALKDAVTVLIRKQGSSLPFNIQGLRIIEYPDQQGGYRETREKIQRFIENGLKSGDSDSPIQPVLEQINKQTAKTDKSKRITTLEATTFQIKGHENQQIEIRTGDIRKWSGIDVWVNSENTNMQMARLYDRNLSALIRYYGARKDENDEILEDTIANELYAGMKGKESVSLGTVITTGAGALLKTHGVKNIFHVASVYGIPGEGYRTAPEIIDTCLLRCLRRMDSEALQKANLSSIAFPMIGTGAGGGNVEHVAKILIDSTASYFAQYQDSKISKVVFMAWNQNDLDACTKVLNASSQIIPV